MDCREVAELIDGYALGAADQAEAAAIEVHVADCVRCWEELTEAQQAATSLALTVPISDAPARLRERIMRKAERDLSPSAVGAGLFSRLRPRLKQPWLAPVASLATGLVVLFALFELQMNSLRGDNNTLQEQLASAGSDVAQIKQINAVLAAGDTRQLPLTARSAGLGAAACEYHWSRGQRLGFVNCSNLEPLAAGQTYQAWLDEVDGSKSLGTCAPLDGRCQFSVDLSHISRRAEGIGLSVEPEGGSPAPTGNWVMYAGFAE